MPGAPQQARRLGLPGFDSIEGPSSPLPQASYGAPMTSRNAPCPCGSGRKYKLCCGAAERDLALRSRQDDAVSDRIADWAAEKLADQLDAALKVFAGPLRRIDDEAERELFTVWFHNDRVLGDGRTPAEAYAARPEIDKAEREAAEQIAAARLGVYRVLEVEPGRSLELLDLVEVGTVRIHSETVSAGAARWDVLLARVLPPERGDPDGSTGLWGPARFFSAAEEPELLAELERLARARGSEPDREGLRGALRNRALELLRFQTPSSLAKPTYFTLEGEPMVAARATWELPDPDVARERLTELGGRDAEEGMLEVDISIPRERLIGLRADKELPVGAVVVESGAASSPDLASVATVRIEGELLSVEALSEGRLDRATLMVEEGLSDLIGEKAERRIVPVADRLADRSEEHEAPRSGSADRDVSEGREVVGEVLFERYRHWVDEPHPKLGGATPRAAVAAGRGEEVVPLVRIVENGAARSAGEHEHEALAELNLLGELGLGERRAA